MDKELNYGFKDGKFYCDEPEIDPVRKEFIERLHRDIKEKGKIMLIASIFGDIEWCDAYLEEIIRPPEGGTFMKLYGCSYLYKGYPDKETVERVDLIKRVFMASVRLLNKSPFRYFVSIMFLLFRKRVIKNLIYWFVNIFEQYLGKIQLPLKEFNVFPRELIRVGLKLAEDVSDEPSKFPDAGQTYRDRIQRLVYCFAMIMEYDNAYRWRVQDILGNLDKDNLKKNPTKEIKRLFNIFIERDFGIQDRIILIRKIVLFLLYVNKKFRTLATQFLMELDIDKVKLDEADFYFCLMRKSYNYRGLNFSSRMKIKDSIDKERGHIIIRI